MSNQSDTAAIVILSLLTIGLLYLLRRERARSKRLKAGQAEYKAFRDSYSKLWRESESELRKAHEGLAAIYDNLRHLTVWIWGEPALNRTTQDVCNFITEMRQQIAGDAIKKAGLAAAFEAQSQQLHNLTVEVNTTRDALDGYRSAISALGDEEGQEEYGRFKTNPEDFMREHFLKANFQK